MRGTVLVAAGGLCREALEVIGCSRPDVVLLDDDAQRWGTELDGHPVVGGLDLIGSYTDHEVVVCAGSGTARRALVARLEDHGVTSNRFGSVVHPSVSVPPTCVLGSGCILLAGVVLTAGVSIGNHVVIMPNATLTHDVAVDDFATVCAGVSLGGGVRVGAEAYLGMNAGVRENVSVAARTTVGMGAMLLRDTTEEETWVGVPARPLRAAPASP